MYKPRPIDTSHTELPATLVHLQEQLAENNHDLWAQQRLADGWTYGRRRHDGHKKHPDLVPYKALPESEKVYDRITAMQTLKTILALRSEERRVGKERRSRWSPYHYKKKDHIVGKSLDLGDILSIKKKKNNQIIAE